MEGEITRGAGRMEELEACSSQQECFVTAESTSSSMEKSTRQCSALMYRADTWAAKTLQDSARREYGCCGNENT